MQGSKLWIHPDQAKAGEAIGIPLSRDAMAVLRGQEGMDKEWVFPYKGRGRAKGKPIAKIKTAWHLAMERAGLGHFERLPGGKKKWHGDFTWHGLRHTWASWHLMAGTPMHVLKELGGWSDMRMVLLYAHLSTEHLRDWAGNAGQYSRKHEARSSAQRKKDQDLQDLGVDAPQV
jgi:integrase